MNRLLSFYYQAGLNRSGIVNRLKPLWAISQITAWWKAGRPLPPPHAIKLYTILFCADLIDAEILIETGTFRGDTVRALSRRFGRVVTIELSAKLAEAATHQFRSNNNVQVLAGDSAVRLAEIITTLDRPTIFWLDAHYSGGPTMGSGHVPIFGELASIKTGGVPHIVLIDDMASFDGRDGYPTVAQLQRHLRSMSYRTATVNGIMIATSLALFDEINSGV